MTDETDETPAVKEPTAFKKDAGIHEKLDYLLEKVKDLLGENDESEADTSLDLGDTNTGS